MREIVPHLVERGFLTPQQIENVWRIGMGDQHFRDIVLP